LLCVTLAVTQPLNVLPPLSETARPCTLSLITLDLGSFSIFCPLATAELVLQRWRVAALAAGIAMQGRTSPFGHLGEFGAAKQPVSSEAQRPISSCDGQATVGNRRGALLIATSSIYNRDTYSRASLVPASCAS
jgi:hypothetical protein